MMAFIMVISEVISAPIQFIESLLGSGHPISEALSRLFDFITSLLG